MLRWSEELAIGFGADRLACARVGRGLNPKVLHKQVVEVSSDPAGPLWRASLQSLPAVLSSAKGQRVSVILSNRFVRYTVVPWHPELMARAERLVQARLCFKQVYGKLADGWAISISDGRYGAPVLATAVDQGLIEGLRDASAGAGSKLISISPYLTAAYSRFRRAMPGASYFGVVEPDAFGLLHFDSAGLRNVFSQRIHEDWTQELLGTMAQSSPDGAIAGPAQGIHVFAPGRSRDGLQRHAAAVALSLPGRPGYSPLTDSSVSMALVGIR